MTVLYQPHHLDTARALRAAIRNRPSGETALTTTARWLLVLEGSTMERCARALDAEAEKERMAGAGALLQQRRGDDGPEVTAKMTEAGARVLGEIVGECAAEQVARAVYLAMLAASDPSERLSRLETEVRMRVTRCNCMRDAAAAIRLAAGRLATGQSSPSPSGARDEVAKLD